VGACGFRPLYRKDAGDPGVMHALAQIKIMNVRAFKPENDRLGQQMQNLLRERLTPNGAPQRPLYILESDLRVTVARTGIQITEEATRARLTVNSKFALKDAATQATLYQGTEQSVNSYNVADSQFATMSAENDAAFRAVREVSDSIRIRLAIYFERQKQG
jgi:LPS-assembly lipoprotein